MIRLNDDEIFTLAENFGCFEYGDAQGHKRIGFANAIQDVLAEKNKGEPIGRIILGGLIETSQGVEFSECESDITQTKLEALQEALVRTPETIYLPVFLAPQPDLSDAYAGAREEVNIWKKRALEAEDINRKFAAELNGPTHMGEPAPQPNRVAELEQQVARLQDVLAALLSHMAVPSSVCKERPAYEAAQAELAASKGDA